ncbi:C40 family peptidase [Kroppenstedtia pulmonis]|uniref:C40 family peptidase n=2 Tax=Kroppenstedtia pulmonis TaxID=1380685 RepID=A0A7D4BM60_9BACL|nr:C40 family peptidase [Kroppenstedtia pulmonis]
MTDTGLTANSKVNQIFERVGINLKKSESLGAPTANAAPDKETNNANPGEKQESVNGEHQAFTDRIIATGEKYLGTPYKFGAPTGQTKTFDCSSFTHQVFKENNVNLPRSSRSQATVGKDVARSDLQKGDLVFFKLRGRENLGIGHVGIYAGNGKLLHTWGPGGVRYDNMSDGWLNWGYVKAKRVTP